MKKTLLLISLGSVAMHAGACGCHSSWYADYSDWGKLQLKGNQLSDKEGNPVQLTGWSTQSLHLDEVQECLGESQWKLMNQYGANIVRLAMNVDAPDAYLSNPDKFKDIVKKSIAETRLLNMYCMIDWHIIPDSINYYADPNDYVAESKDFFGEISKYCSDNGYDHVLYEICNEPNCGWINVKNYAEEVIPVITANQPDAIIVVGTDQWCLKIMEPVSNPINPDYKKNVMYSFHYYACSHYSFLGDFRNAQKNIPVFVSEWSAFKFDGSGPFCAQNGDEMLKACEKLGTAPQYVSWCIGTWGGKKENSSFLENICDAKSLSSYKDDNGKKYSDYVYELMPYCYAPDPTILNIITSTEFFINPNPTSGEFTITLAENIEANVEIVNMAGQVVASQKIVGSASINKSLPAGVYTVVVKSNGGVSTQKLVVK